MRDSIAKLTKLLNEQAAQARKNEELAQILHENLETLLANKFTAPDRVAKEVGSPASVTSTPATSGKGKRKNHYLLPASPQAPKINYSKANMVGEGVAI